MNSKIIERLIQEADEAPDKIAITIEDRSITYKTLMTKVYELADWFRQSKKKCVGVCLKNNIEWLVIDLACIMVDITHVALSEYLSDQQMTCIINQVNPDIIICDNAERFTLLGLKYTSCNKMSGLDVLTPMLNKKKKISCSSCRKIDFIDGNADYAKSACINQCLIDQKTLDLRGYMQGRHLIANSVLCP